MHQPLRMPSLVNAHTHSAYGPHFKGVIPAQTFESYMIDISVRYFRPETPQEASAFALVTGLDNLSAGHTAIIDSSSVPLTKEHLYAVAQAYEELGLRAWIFTEIADLPILFYTREAYPRYPHALPLRDLPAGLQELCAVEDDYRDQLDALQGLILGWQSERVRIGVGITNPVWCSDGLIRDAADLARSMDVPLSFHVEESPLQRQVHMAQWGMSGFQRADALGALGPRTLLIHAVQADEGDIALIAKRGSTVCHAPISNLKIRNGIAPVGAMISAGINVCLGTDGHSVGDVEDLFPVMKFVAALSCQNGIATLGGFAEDTALRMATENGYSLWPGADFSEDWIQLDSPIGPFGPVWDAPTSKIREVYIDGQPRLAKARTLVASRGVIEYVASWHQKLLESETERRARSLATWVEDTTQPWLAEQ